jgi:DNA-directed RNA polymerase specialized sigma24 family protein
MSNDEPNRVGSADNRHFATTQWSIVVAAGRGATAESRQALAVLCSAYWFPLYAFVRRSGHSVSDAEDLTQAFFGRFLEKHDVAAADRHRGKFRSFLLAAMQHFLSNQRDREHAQKRGGGRQPLPLDFASGESRYQNEPCHALTAEKLFQQQWAVALLNRVLAALRLQYTEAGKDRLFDGLKACLAAGGPEARYSDLAADLGMTEGAVKVAAHRLRHRYRDLLREAIAETVATPQEVEDEIRDLFGAFGR